MQEPRIWDIHCHALFGVDDGAKSIEQSNKMLDIAYHEGIRAIILTPHDNRRIWNVDKDKLYEKYENLVKLAEEKYPELSIYLGSELFYGSDTEEYLQSGNIRTMAKSDYLLVEFNTSISYGSLRQGVMEVIQYGYVPIIAHVERYECVLKDYTRIYQLKELGAYIQVNVSGVMGEHGRMEKKFIKYLLKNRLVDFVATDAHRDDKRAPYISKCYKHIAKKYSEEYAQRLFEYNPSCIIKNILIEE